MKRGQSKIDARDPSFTARDVKDAAGLSYRQLNDWDSKGALPNSREQEASWRKFSTRDLFVLMVCSEVRTRYGTPLEKLGWLKSIMLQEAGHFEAAVGMMNLGLAVFIFTDLEKSFSMESDIDIADLLNMGYCRFDHQQAYIFLSVNPIVNRILAALKDPVRLDVSDAVYKALWTEHNRFRAQDFAELAVLDAMRDNNLTRFIVTKKGDQEILLESEEELPTGADLNTAMCSHNFQTVTVKRHEGKNVWISRLMPKKISRRKIWKPD